MQFVAVVAVKITERKDNFSHLSHGILSVFRTHSARGQNGGSKGTVGNGFSQALAPYGINY